MVKGKTSKKQQFTKIFLKMCGINRWIGKQAKEKAQSSDIIIGFLDQHFNNNSTINSTYFLNFYSLVPKGRKSILC